jgi:hypothetical protein
MSNHASEGVPSSSDGVFTLRVHFTKFQTQTPKVCFLLSLNRHFAYDSQDGVFISIAYDIYGARVSHLAD